MVTPAGPWVNESAAKSLPLGMTEIILNEGDRIDWAIKAFRRKVQRSNVLKDARKKRHYVKPSLAKRLKKQAAMARQRKRNREE
jgi:small subunit ribosomal protein S21